jgi:hypothetical protein
MVQGAIRLHAVHNNRQGVVTAGDCHVIPVDDVRIDTGTCDRLPRWSQK